MSARGLKSAFVFPILWESWFTEVGIDQFEKNTRLCSQAIIGDEVNFPMQKKRIIFITHADIVVDPSIPVPCWHLSERGRKRHEKFNKHQSIENVKTIYCSEENKAIDGAEILAREKSLSFDKVVSLHENDRSATGFLPPEEFQMVADQFFGTPFQSVRGWERAIDAQNRILGAVNTIVQKHIHEPGDIAIVAHGGVGTLLLCFLKHTSISRDHDQPSNGGGNFFQFYAPTFELIHDWMPIDN